MALEFRQQNQIFKSLQSYLNSISDTLTDFSIGSILNSIFYAISNGIADLYASIQNVYQANFVATAEGDDLDDKVADFNLLRRQPTRSSGYITFYSNNVVASDVVISVGTSIKTLTTNLLDGVEFQTTIESVLSVQITNEQIEFVVGRSDYNLSSRKVYDIEEVLATIGGSPGTILTKGVDYVLDETDSSQAKISFTGVTLPDVGTYFFTTYKPLSIDVPIQSTASGSFGNVAVGTIVNSANKPAGVDEVYNYDQISGGTDQETDEELRNRVPLYLSSLSKGTKDAIIAAALSIDGVKNANVFEPDPPNGVVTIFIDDGSGGSTSELIRLVKDEINGTTNGAENDLEAGIRSAGIAVNVTSPTIKQIVIDVTFTLAIGYDSETVKSQITSDVATWLNAHPTDQDVIRADLIKVIKQISGVENIDLDTLSVNGITSGDLEVSSGEVARLSEINIRVKV